MKKPIWVVFLLLFCWGVGFAQYPNSPETRISEVRIEQYLEEGKRLPLYLHQLGELGAKESLSEIAKFYAEKLGTYNAYYNAAVIFFTPETFYGEDVNPGLNKNEMDNVVKYASLAINKNPKSPDMYLIRVLARYRFYGLSDVTGIFGGVHARWIKTHKEIVDSMLEDFKAVERLDSQLAPYAEMKKLYRGLGQEDEAERCSRAAKKRRKYYSQVEENVREGFLQGANART